jgi:hypothetical protein
VPDGLFQMVIFSRRYIETKTAMGVWNNALHKKPWNNEGDLNIP